MTGNAPKLTDFKVLVFDVYGTLADWESGIYDAMQPLLSRYSSAKWTRADALKEFESAEKDIQVAQPGLLYTDVLEKAHEVLEKCLDNLYGKPAIADIPGAHVAFGNSIKNWSIFPDSSQALHDLAKRYKLVVLSNVDRISFAHTHTKLSTGDPFAVSSPLYACPKPNPHGYWFPQKTIGSQSPFSLILTAQDVHSYKPALPGFLIALDVIQKDLLDTPTRQDTKEKVLWVAQSLFHDVGPASSLGIRSAWINRQGASMGADEGNQKWVWKFKTLGEMAEAVEKEAEET
ncbi:haloacid dehalogenase [Desarmillaria ectypa]|nr:haloacid dehalogenase [Desarmillaria ectypa]